MSRLTIGSTDAAEQEASATPSNERDIDWPCGSIANAQEGGFKGRIGTKLDKVWFVSYGSPTSEPRKL
jgi:hypothetical protein